MQTELEIFQVTVTPEGYFVDGARKSTSEVVEIAESYAGQKLQVCIEHDAPNEMVINLTNQMRSIEFKGEGFVSTPSCE